MRFFFSSDELSVLRSVLQYAIDDHELHDNRRPVSKHGLRMVKKLQVKLELGNKAGVVSVSPVPGCKAPTGEGEFAEYPRRLSEQ